MEINEKFKLAANIESDEIQIYCTKFLVRDVLQDIINQLETQYKEKEISIELDIDSQLRLYGDKSLILHIFKILIDNAIKYSNEKVQVQIRAINQYQGVYNPKNNDGVLFQIIDSGKGISEKDQLQLFKRFKRFVKFENIEYIPGIGLESYIARVVVRKHKGDIFVTSIPSKGSTFFIFFPRLKNLLNGKG